MKSSKSETIYDMLALILRLKRIPKDDIASNFDCVFEGDRTHIPIELYIDENGNKFYRDKYGFHSVNQLVNTRDHILKRLENIKTKRRLKDKYKSLMDEALTKKHKKMVRIITNSNHLTPEEKLEHIINYINNV